VVLDPELTLAAPEKGAGGELGVWVKTTFPEDDSICKITFLEILVIEGSDHRK
jgi:hypothetical protein